MSFLKFFMTPSARRRAERRDRRHALRQAENAVGEVEERIKRLEKEASAEWEKARAATKEGNQAAAQRALTSYRSAQVMITKMEQKKWVFKQVLMKLETAGTDAAFASALGMVNRVTEINPEMVEDVFDEAGDLLAEAGDADKFWAQMYGKEVEGSKGALQDHIPSMEDLEKSLQEEVAGKIQGGIDPSSLEKAI